MTPKRRLMVGVALLAAGVFAIAAPAGAASDADGEAKVARLEVDAGYGGYHVPGRVTPVRVTVDADRLLRGDLVAETRDGTRTSLDDVEVPGGSVKRFTLLLPAGRPGFGGDGNVVRVELRDGKRVVARGEKNLSFTAGQELVGLLPEVLGGRAAPGPAALSVDAGVARFVALNPSDLSSADALASLSAIGLRAGELAELRPAAQQAIAGWVAGGGQLLVDDAPAGDLDGLPDSWTPSGGAARVAAGRGEVRLTDGALAAGRVAGLVDPTIRGRLDFSGGFGTEGVAQTVARDAGLRLPGLVLLLVFLGVYLLAVGPLTAVVLRRRGRPELAWVVVPALALVFTVAAYGMGSRTRSRTTVAHGTIIESNGDSAVAVSYLGVTRPGSGTARVAFPAGWTVSGDPGTGRFPDVALTSDGPEARLPLAVGQFGLVRASGPVEVPGHGLVVQAIADDGEQAHGSVHNRLPYALSEVTVFVGRGVASVGDLAPGEEKEWKVTGGRGNGFGNGGGPNMAWFERFPGDWWSNDEATGKDGTVNLPLWQEVRALLGPEEHAPGVATAVGWTRSHKPEFNLDGKRRSPSGRTAFVTRAAVGAEPGRAPHLATEREVLRGTFPTFWGGGGDPSEGTVMRFTLPETADPARPLELRSSLRLQSLEVWTQGTWRPLGDPKVGLVVDGVRRGPGVKVFPAPVPVPTTVVLPPPVPPPFPPGATTETTVAIEAPVAVAPTAPPPAPPAIAVGPDGMLIDPNGQMFTIDASDGISVPAGAVTGGREVFVRVRFADFDPDSSVTLGEAS